MSKNNFELELNPQPTALDDVAERLHEALLLNPPSKNECQFDFITQKHERKEQILYYLRKTILIKRHADLACEFATILLEDDNLPF